MSSTNRGGKRSEADFYATPAWCVHRLLERVLLPNRFWLEPAAGDGAIIKAVNDFDMSVYWHANELRKQCRTKLEQLTSKEDVRIGSFGDMLHVVNEEPDVIITNPPFSLAMEFLEHSLKLTPNYVVLLLRLNFLGSAERGNFFRNNMPDIYILPNRPSFTGKGTDSVEYCWMIWTPERNRRYGKLEILDETPLDERTGKKNTKTSSEDKTSSEKISKTSRKEIDKAIRKELTANSQDEQKQKQKGEQVVQQSQESTQENDEMANLPKHLADEVGKSRTAGGGNFIQYGDYVFMIGKWFFQHIQDDCIITELFTGESRKKVVYEGSKAVEQEPNAEGSECSEVANFDGAGKLSAKANARAVVLGLFGFKENEVADDVVSKTLAQVCNENDVSLGAPQPANGMLIGCSTFAKEIKSRKGEYITGRSWSFIAKPGEGLNAPDMVRARLEARRLGPEQCVAVIKKQLAEARASGNVPVLGAAPSTTAAPSVITAPSLPTAPPIAIVDPLAGWTQHPENAEYVFRGQEVKKKAELIAAASH